MTGARTTGKSCYVGVVMRAFERYLVQMQVTLSPTDAWTGPTFKRLYEEPLVDNQRLLLATSRTIDSEPGPLIWKMEASNGRPRYLVIGHLAGEDLETTLGQADHLTLIARPDAVLLEHPANGRPVRHRFFAVSALGQPPRAEAINQRGIAPHRCLDPMKWVLSEMGVIRK